MAHARNASARWAQLDGQRRGFITRCELYAAYTLPKLCTPDGYDQNNTELSHDFQAVGAQAVNHLTNKLMLASFAPSVPFFRADPDAELKAKASAIGLPLEQLVEMCAAGEKEAVAELDRRALRPKLYEIFKHLVVIGNVLMCLEDDTIRVKGIKKYCARRSESGQVLELLMRDDVQFDELDAQVQEHLKSVTTWPDDRKVVLYKWIKRNAAGDYLLEQWVEEFQLPKRFSGKWPEAQLPYRALTWDLSDDAHYGTGLVEDYKGDFAGLSTLTTAQVQGAVLASEFRWLVNPAGMTKPEDFMESANGEAIPGQEGDVTLVQSGKAGDLQIAMSMAGEYVSRIGRGFLLGTAVTRDAERVTAEEIRMQATELETSLGGAYSRLAVDLQVPIAYWLMDLIKLSINGTGIRPTIVTGMDALSRSRDLEELKLWLADMAALAQLPESLQGALNMAAIATALATPRRIDVKGFMLSQETMQANAKAQQQQELETEAGKAGINATAQMAVDNNSQG